MKLKHFFVLFLFIGSLFCLAVQDADAARRFGGGKSFGSKPSMSQKASPSKQQQPGVTQNSATKKSGFLGGAGGMLGGLLAGTLLGSLLFGGGFDGGFMDIILLGLLAFLAYKLYSAFKRRSASNTAPSMKGAAVATGAYGASQNAYGASKNAYESPKPQTMQYQNAQPDQNTAGGWGGLGGGQAQSAPEIPPNFDVQNFLEGAKVAFARLQKSWDKRDVDDIALFTSPAVLAEIKAQLAEDDSVGNHEVLLNNAQLLRVVTENNEEMATVYFDVVMREGSSNETMQVREVWHFARPLSGGNWKLDGIQQMED